MTQGQFQFKGTGGSYLLLIFWTSLLTIFTVGLYFPWMMAAKQKWIAKNTYIDGRGLVFKGTGASFFGNYILILFLILITLGIYAPWGFCRLQRWITNNTHFADKDDVKE